MSQPEQKKVETKSCAKCGQILTVNGATLAFFHECSKDNFVHMDGVPNQQGVFHKDLQNDPIAAKDLNKFMKPVEQKKEEVNTKDFFYPSIHSEKINITHEEEPCNVCGRLGHNNCIWVLEAIAEAERRGKMEMAEELLTVVKTQGAFQAIEQLQETISSLNAGE